MADQDERDVEFPIVYVRWADSYERHGWHEEGGARAPFIIQTVGMLVEETADALVVAHSWAHHDYDHPRTNDFTSPMTIPKIAILASRKLGTMPVEDYPTIAAGDAMTPAGSDFFKAPSDA